ncbi:MAG: helical backbone metal receptor [Planctomycetia bacterium]|nr:helical backbone metal receptor [Planctomycetia bacterium]
MKLSQNFKVIGLLLGILLAGCQEEKGVSRSDSPPSRVVTLSPAITEMLYELGCQDRIVGVTRFCRYPTAAREKACVGGFLDPNYEAIFKLRPDSVLIPVGADELRQTLERYDQNVLEIPQRSLEDVYFSLRLLGKTFGVESRAEAKIAEMQRELAEVAEKSRGKKLRRVLMVVGRDYQSERLEEVYIVGKDGLCNPLLEMAGGKNVYNGETPFPKISEEAILQMNPEVILEIQPCETQQPANEALSRKAWERLSEVEAVQKGRIFLMKGEPPLLPSPILTHWVKYLAELLQKER